MYFYRRSRRLLTSLTAPRAVTLRRPSAPLLISPFPSRCGRKAHLLTMSSSAERSFSSSSPSTNNDDGKPVQRNITSLLTTELSPSHLVVENESSMHNVPRGSETHFKVTIVSDAFQGQKLLARHRVVNKILAPQLAGPVHALSLVLKTPQEWSKVKPGSAALGRSPACRGGDGAAAAKAAATSSSESSS